MAISAVGTLRSITTTTTQTTLTGWSPAAIGNAGVLVVKINDPSNTVSSVTGSKTSWTRLSNGSAGPGNIHELWLGAVTGTGAETLTIGYSSAIGAISCDIMLQEFTNGNASTTWSAFQAGGLIKSTPSTTVTFPALDPPAAAALYVGHARCPTASTYSGVTAGFTSQTDSNANPYIYGVISTSASPTETTASTANYSIAAVITATSGPVFSAAAMDATSSLVTAGGVMVKGIATLAASTTLSPAGAMLGKAAPAGASGLLVAGNVSATTVLSASSSLTVTGMTPPAPPAAVVTENGVGPSGPWTVYAFETVTGRIAAEIPFAGSMQYTRQINTQGSGSINIPLTGNGLSNALANQVLNPWRWSLALCFNRKIIQAGPIVAESYTDQQGQSNVTISGIWALFAKRLVSNPSWVASGTPAVTAADTTFTSFTDYQIAKRLMANSLSRGNAPIDLPADDVAGVNTQTYFGYDMNTVSDMITNITQLVGGPEIEFSPYFDPANAGFIRWAMNIGRPTLGQGAASPWAYDYGKVGCCTAIDVAIDGSKMTFRDYVRGSGSQYTQIIGTAATSTAVGPYPLLEDVDGNHTSVVSLATANRYAQANVNTYQYPISTWSAYVSVDAKDGSGRATGSPRLDEISMGDWANFTVQGHRRLADGIYSHRIIGINNATDDVAKLILQPTVGVL